ncbi:MAG: glycosyltransferase, partial [bacterium]
MKILCVFGEHNYGEPARGHGYEYVNFIPAFRRLGHEVVFFESLNKKTYKDFTDLNRKFPRMVESEKPDIIFCVLMGYELWLETLQMVRENSDALLINWATDDSWKYEQFSRFMAPAFHAYATTYPTAVSRARQDGFSNFILTQWAASAEKLAEPLPAAKCRYRVSFVGSAYGNRHKWMAELKEHGIDVNCFGYGWNNGPVTAEEIPKIVRESVVSLNFSDSGLIMKGLIPCRSRQIKARTFEVPGAGGFLMTENADDLNRFYVPGKEAVSFDGINDLVDKIRFFLAHPEERDKIAGAGHVRTRNEHSYDVRFRNLIAAALQLRTIQGSKDTTAVGPPNPRLTPKYARGIFHQAGVAARFIGLLITAPINRRATVGKF